MTPPSVRDHERAATIGAAREAALQQCRIRIAVIAAGELPIEREAILHLLGKLLGDEWRRNAGGQFHALFIGVQRADGPVFVAAARAFLWGQVDRLADEGAWLAPVGGVLENLPHNNMVPCRCAVLVAG